jgi:hypothetical protein
MDRNARPIRANEAWQVGVTVLILWQDLNIAIKSRELVQKRHGAARTPAVKQPPPTPRRGDVAHHRQDRGDSDPARNE